MNRHSIIVQQILDKLPPEERRNLDMTPNLSEKAKELLRVLETKVKTGRLGKFDTLESRAAIVLEHVARTMGHQFSTKALARALGMKANNFKSLQHKVGNYLHELSVGDNSAKKRKRAHSKTKKSTNQFNAASSASGGNNSKDVGNNESESPPASIMPGLSIRLGPLVPDSLGFAHRAEQLLRDIQQHINNMRFYFRRDALNDLNRHRAVYEAACFYLVATQATTNVKKSRSIVSGNNDGAGQGGDTQDGEQEQEQQQLEVRDVIRASSVSEGVFKAVLPIVTKYAAEVAEKGGTTETSSERAGNSKRLNGGQEDEEAPEFVYSQRFTKWRIDVLAKAREEARDSISKQSSGCPREISDSTAIERAAHNVLRKHGLY